MKLPTYEELLDELEKHRKPISAENLTPDMIKIIIAGREKKPVVSYPNISKILRDAYRIELGNRSIENFYNQNKEKWLKLYGNGLK